MSKRLTTEEFIEKAKSVHGNKYDYTNTIYINNHTNINYYCNETEKYINQSPRTHLKYGKPKLKLDKNSFIQKSNKLYNNKYNYNEVEYVNLHTKVKIYCEEHGIFEQIPSSHLNGHSCVKCGINKLKLTQEEFIKRSNLKHNNIYNYEKVIYIGSNYKVEIICKEHGSFFITPSSHMNGSICKKCVIKEQTFSTDFFIERAKKIHGDKYNYENSNYTNNRTKIEIICNKHGIFIQNPLNHIKGAGCPNCAIDNLFLNNDTFIERSINFHCNKYNYKNVNYINNLTKVEIICNKHGSFLQIPYYHIQGAGCPNCRNSKGEEKIFNWLIKHNILFKREKIFNDCKYNSFLYFDFYLPKHNLCIEFDGKQHYEPIEFFGGEEGFIETQKRDKIKNEYCVINNIKLIRIRYDENIEYKLNEFFKLN